MNITVYCGARDGNDPLYIEKAKELGVWIAEHGHKLIYGAGDSGIMGAISNAALDHGGDVLGVIPYFMVELEWVNKRLVDPIYVDTMYERKNIMIEQGDVFIAMPGGIGTIDEISEVICLSGLERMKRPDKQIKIVFFNVNHYYDPLKVFFQTMVDKNFFPEDQNNTIYYVDSVEELGQILTENESSR